MKNATVALALTGLLTVMLPIQASEAQSRKLTLMAALEKRDGSPATGVKVYIFPYRDGSVIHGLALVDGKFGPSNPQGTSDSKGHVTIEFTRDYLEENKTEDFCVGLFVLGTTPPVVLLRNMAEPHATPILHLSVFGKQNRLDLNKVFKKVIVE